jgi:hypothetical protein
MSEAVGPAAQGISLAATGEAVSAEVGSYCCSRNNVKIRRCVPKAAGGFGYL